MLDVTAITEAGSQLMAASRSNTPALNIRTPNPRPAHTTKEWEAKAPLGDVEIKSVGALKATCEQRPVFQPSTIRFSPSPFHSSMRPQTNKGDYFYIFLEEADPASRPATPQQRGPGSRLSTPLTRADAVYRGERLRS